MRNAAPARTWQVLCVSFFVSGCSALIYQVSWQRALFAVVGVDIDSVTVIVSCFMLGIGIGGALGGVLADAFPAHAIRVYAAAELLLAAFGLGSLAFVRQVGDAVTAAGAGIPATGAAVFVLLALPTTCMGVTLPVLTMAFNAALRNIGQSVGTLYFWNTLGAAFAAWACPFLLFDHFTLDAAVRLAAAGNLCVAAAALACHRFATAAHA